MHAEIIAQVIEECRDKADAYLRCAEALAHLLPDSMSEPVLRVVPPPRQVRRVLGSQADYQAAVLALLAQTEGGLGIAALVERTGIKRNSVAVALRTLQTERQIQKVGDFKTAVYCAGPRLAQVGA